MRTRLLPGERDKRHPEAVLRSASRAFVQAQPAKRRRQMAIDAYEAGEISIGKAAEMMGISR